MRSVGGKLIRYKQRCLKSGGGVRYIQWVSDGSPRKVRVSPRYQYTEYTGTWVGKGYTEVGKGSDDLQESFALTLWKVSNENC